MTAEYDVIVIGAGVAGLTAGAFLAERGYRVAAVTQGEPTVCLSTGCIDVCSHDHDPLHGISHLPDEHPYHLITGEGIKKAIERFGKIMETMGLPYVGSSENNRRVLSALGTYKTTCLAPVTMASSPQNAHDALHIVTFSGLRDFYPGYIISRRRNVSQSVCDAGVTTTMGIAAKFEQEGFLETFIDWLEQLNIKADRIAFPAVLGLESAAQIIRKMEERLGRPVFEIPTLPPSMPGRRLFNALKDYFRRQGGAIYWNWPVSGVEKAGKVIEAVVTPSEGRPKSLNAKAFILSSGSFVGGGLTARRDRICENIFDLPVYVPGPRESWHEEDYFSLDHGIGKAGVIVDASFRAKEAPRENVFICGAVIAYAEILKNGCGHGLALATGQEAAKACAEYLS